MAESCVLNRPSTRGKAGVHWLRYPELCYPGGVESGNGSLASSPISRYSILAQYFASLSGILRYPELCYPSGVENGNGNLARSPMSRH